VFGGMNATSAPVASCESFDPGTQSWSPIAPMPQPREGFTATEFEGLIYCVGGWSPTEGFTARCDIYDPATDTWTAGPPMPETRAYHGAYRAGDRLFIVFGIHQAWGGEGWGCALRDGAWTPDVVDTSVRAQVAFAGFPEWTPWLYVFTDGLGSFIHRSWPSDLDHVASPHGSPRNYVVVQDEKYRMYAIGSENPQYVLQAASALPMAIHMRLD